MEVSYEDIALKIAQSVVKIQKTAEIGTDICTIDTLIQFLNSSFGNDEEKFGSDENEQAEIEKWIRYSVDLHAASFNPKLHPKVFGIFNRALSSAVYLVGNRLTMADFCLFYFIEPLVRAWDFKERTSPVHLNITRWFDFLQHQDIITTEIIEIEKKVPVPEKKAAAKGKAKGQPKAKAKGKAQPNTDPIDISRLDIRIGKIVDCKKHEGADKLYVEQIDLGEESGPRTIVSGLVHFIPLEEMKDQYVTVLANLKAQKMVGIESHGMVLCASNADHTTVQLIQPPEGVVGEPVTFEGFESKPDTPFMNPKKKIFQQVQPDLLIDGDSTANYKGIPFMTKSGKCKCKSITNGTVS